MKKSTNTSKAIASKNVIETKESVNVEKNRLTEINLSEYSEQLQNVDLKVKKDKDALYVYPSDFSKEDINGEKGKRFRASCRNKIKSFSNNIFFYTKAQNAEMLQSEINKFNDYYKLHYSLNDYSVSSLTRSKDEKHIELMLTIIKDVLKA